MKECIGLEGWWEIRTSLPGIVWSRYNQGMLMLKRTTFTTEKCCIKVDRQCVVLFLSISAVTFYSQANIHNDDMDIANFSAIKEWIIFSESHLHFSMQWNVPIFQNMKLKSEVGQETLIKCSHLTALHWNEHRVSFESALFLYDLHVRWGFKPWSKTVNQIHMGLLGRVGVLPQNINLMTCREKSGIG